jgi:hypothetical protein
MSPLPAGREASPSIGAARYQRHRPERTILLPACPGYHPVFKVHLAVQGSELPGYFEHVEQEFEDYHKCGRLAAFARDF